MIPENMGSDRCMEYETETNGIHIGPAIKIPLNEGQRV
jgi:hypothetical protein